jgi:TolB-like protein
MQRLFWATLAVLMIGYGCGPRFAASKNGSEVIRRGARVAIMPFENLSGRENASEKMTEFLVLSLRRVNVLEMIELGQTYEQMRRHRVRSSTFLTGDQIDSLASSLKVDYIMTGTVLEYTETDNTYLGKIPQVSVNLRLVSCATRKTVWAGASNARGDQSELLFGVGAIRTREELARQVIDKAVNQLSTLVSE